MPRECCGECQTSCQFAGKTIRAVINHVYLKQEEETSALFLSGPCRPVLSGPPSGPDIFVREDG
ncbi:MAG: six-cysteine ranthipeptide SCIFF [bacterium]